MCNLPRLLLCAPACEVLETDAQDELLVQGVIDLMAVRGEECIIRRELLAESGRSRLYVNDSLRSQEAVRELRTQLLIHTSQHGQQQLLQPAFQARFMESVVPCRDLLEARDELLRRLRAEADALDELKEKICLRPIKSLATITAW